MTGFAKLFSSIVTSTLWQEDSDTCKVWVTMLAMADAKGYVDATVPGLANVARVSVDKTREAIAKFLSPDPDSRTKTHKGRRIKKVEGGWQLLNYQSYREKRDPNKRREQNRQAQQRYRQKHKATGKHSKPKVSQDKPKSAQAEAEAEAEKNPPISPLGDEAQSPVVSGCHKTPPEVQQVFDAWNAHAGKSVSKPNDQGAIRKITWRGHSKLSREKVQAITSALKDYSAEDVVGAVDNFATVLLGREYFWSYPWTLNEFLTRPRERHKDAERQWWQFLPDNFDAERFRRHGPEAEALYEDPTVEEGLEIARKLDEQAAEAGRVAV